MLLMVMAMCLVAGNTQKPLINGLLYFLRSTIVPYFLQIENNFTCISHMDSNFTSPFQNVVARMSTRTSCCFFFDYFVRQFETVKKSTN